MYVGEFAKQPASSGSTRPKCMAWRIYRLHQTLLWNFYMCEICGVKLLRGLEAHVKKCHPESSPEFRTRKSCSKPTARKKCPICGVMISGYSSTFKRHVRRHKTRIWVQHPPGQLGDVQRKQTGWFLDKLKVRQSILVIRSKFKLFFTETFLIHS